MTHGPGPGAHLDLEVLAELEEGIAADAAAAESHLHSCTLCQQRAGTLRASRALLSALPADPMPPDVAARISAALAAERASPVRSTTVVPLRRGTRLWRGVNVAAAAAGVAVVGLVTALVVGRHGSSGAGGQSGDTAASVKAPAASPQSLKQWQTGATYTKATVPALVTGLVLGNPPAASGPGGPLGAAAGPTASTRPGLAQSLDRSSLRSPAAVTACARILNQAPVAPIAVDEGNYGGRPATVIVLPDRLHPERTLDVWVVRTVCSDSAADLAYFTVDRPR